MEPKKHTCPLRVGAEQATTQVAGSNPVCIPPINISRCGAIGSAPVLYSGWSGFKSSQRHHLTKGYEMERLHKVISQQMGANLEDIKPESKLSEDLDFDSLDRVELVMAIEEEFEIKPDIPDEIYDNWVTVGDVEAYLASLPVNQ